MLKFAYPTLASSSSVASSTLTETRSLRDTRLSLDAVITPFESAGRRSQLHLGVAFCAGCDSYTPSLPTCECCPCEYCALTGGFSCWRGGPSRPVKAAPAAPKKP